MLCSRFKQILLTNTSVNNNKNCSCLFTRQAVQQKCWADALRGRFIRIQSDQSRMSSIRFILKDFGVWSRNFRILNTVRRLRRERTVRDVLLCFKHALFRPKRTLFLSAAAAYKVKAEEFVPPPCANNITDQELQSILSDFEGAEDLSRRTLYCMRCKKRLVIEKKQPGIDYCSCKESEQPMPSPDGWVPYLEAEGVVIWRKEYKPGQGLYAYKVFGRYPDVAASDYAAVQVDGAYRKQWDSAVASLSVVQRGANGLPDQTVLHWEVLWPRLFANRDYVYLRRHKEFEIKPTKQSETHAHAHKVNAQHTANTQHTVNAQHTANTQHTVNAQHTIVTQPERPSVHSNAKRKSQELYEKESANLVEISNRKEPCKLLIRLDEKDCSKEQKDQEKLRQKACEEGNKKICNSQQDAAFNSDGKTSGSTMPGAKIASSSLPDSDFRSNKLNKAYVIVSRSCVHPDVPVTKHAIRVNEYWSNMVIRTVEGSDSPGMQFVLTYYDEPGVGGMPTVVASWASGQAAPAFLARMKQAARDYERRPQSVDPDFVPFKPGSVSYEGIEEDMYFEEEMESSKLGPDLKEQNDETEDLNSDAPCEENERVRVYEVKVGEDESEEEESESEPNDEEEPSGTEIAEQEGQADRWWKQMYPFYYF